MTKAQPNPIKVALNRHLEKCGFHRKGNLWFRAVQGIIQVIDLQKSDYSKLFYLNVGLYFTDLGTLKTPMLSDCQACFRLETLYPKRHDEILAFLSYEDGPGRMTESNVNAIFDMVAPLIERWRSVQAVRDHLAEWPDGRCHVKLAARPLVHAEMSK